MKTARAVVIPALVLVGASMLADSDTEAKSTPTPTESAMMNEDDAMMSGSPTPEPAMSDDMMSDG